jgi:hypothetical protein
LTFYQLYREWLCKQSDTVGAGQAQESNEYGFSATNACTTELLAEQTPEIPAFLVLVTGFEKRKSERGRFSVNRVLRKRGAGDEGRNSLEGNLQVGSCGWMERFEGQKEWCGEFRFAVE